MCNQCYQCTHACVSVYVFFMYMYVRVCVCVRVCVRPCLHAFVRVCVLSCLFTFLLHFLETKQKTRIKEKECKVFEMTSTNFSHSREMLKGG